MHRKRRSARIAKELDIVLLGTGTTGKMFFRRNENCRPQPPRCRSTLMAFCSSIPIRTSGRMEFPPPESFELVAPFSPGETALFVAAKIKRIEALSGGKVFRYGVEYVNSSIPARPSSTPAIGI